RPPARRPSHVRGDRWLISEYLFLSCFARLLCRSSRSRRNEAAERHQIALWSLLFEDVLAVERGHASVLGLLLGSAGAEVFFARVLGDALVVEVVLRRRVHVLFDQLELVLGGGQVHFLAAGEDLVPAVLLVPLGERGRHVHLLDDVAPAHAGVVSAEADLALL